MMCLKFTSPGTRGMPDRIVIHQGRVVFVETKSGVGRTMRLQEVIHATMRAHGADVRVINTRELVDDLIRELCS